MGIEKELSQMCAMIESGKLCYADAVYYLNLMRKKYGIWEKEFRQIYDVWSQKGELSGELDRHRDRAEDEADGLYQRVLDGLYEMVELGEITLEMMTENLWEDAYETKENACTHSLTTETTLPARTPRTDRHRCPKRRCTDFQNISVGVYGGTSPSGK